MTSLFLGGGARLLGAFDKENDVVTVNLRVHDIRVVLNRFGSNIIFSNGLRDLYSSAGVLKDISDNIIAVTTRNVISQAYECIAPESPVGKSKCNTNLLVKRTQICDFKHWGGGGATAAPILAYLGEESSLDDDLALQVYIEHRFYGKSVPFVSSKDALKNATLRGYFNSAQALADYAKILLHIKEKFIGRNVSHYRCWSILWRK
ncbi:hypothetical protein CUMW_164900 [Citrus unshiu]|uniref:Uncharacterized protein n=1 Tax=Citrus unshiu TaxID=55188 RepID=A0A2H5PT63_CITUN|nr:hypothetical protein CUMW_164900 [Citrus unshiu]